MNASFLSSLQNLYARASRTLSTMRGLRAAGIALVCLAATAFYASFLSETYKITTWLAWPLLAIWAYCLLLNVACFGAGNLLLRRVFKQNSLPLLESAVLSFVCGLLAFVLVLYAVGAFSLFKPWMAIALPSTCIALSAPSLRAFAKDLAQAASQPRKPNHPASNAFVIAAWLTGAIFLLFIYLQLMTPDSINYDASWCHMTVGADYARHGRLVPFYADYARAMPQLKSLVDTWAFLVPGLYEPLRWMLCLHLEFCVFLWTLASIAAMTRYLLGDTMTRATWIAFFLFPAIYIYDSNIGGAADHYLALFAAPFFLSAMRASNTFDPRACALAGIVAGAALNTKYQAVYYIFGIGLIVIGRFLARTFSALRRRPEGSTFEGPSFRTILTGSSLLVGCMILVMIPHFTKNTVFYRNPLYPFLQDVFTSSRPTFPTAAFWVENLFKDIRYRPQGTLGHRILEALKLTITYSFKPHYSFTNNYPNAGSLFTLTLPLLLFIRDRRRIFFGAIAAMGALFAWAMTYLVDRHLQVMMPLLAASTAALCIRAWELGPIARTAIVPLIALQIIWGGDALVYSGSGRIESSLNLIASGYSKKAAHRFGYRSEYRELGAALPPNAVILFHDRPSLGINRDILRDTIGEQGLFHFDAFPEPRAFYDYLRQQGVTHFIAHKTRSPMLTMQAEILMTEVWSKAASTTHIHSFAIYAMPEQPLPQRAGYRVLTLGITGYPDGLYDLSALNIVEVPGRAWLHYPKPITRAPTDPQAQETFAAQADCVLVASSRKTPPPLSAFTQAARYPNFNVYLSKQAP